MVTFREMDFSAAASTGEDPVTPNGRLAAWSVPDVRAVGREQALHDGADSQRREDRDHGPPAARRVV